MLREALPSAWAWVGDDLECERYTNAIDAVERLRRMILDGQFGVTCKECWGQKARSGVVDVDGTTSAVGTTHSWAYITGGTAKARRPTDIKPVSAGSAATQFPLVSGSGRRQIGLLTTSTSDLGPIDFHRLSTPPTTVKGRQQGCTISCPSTPLIHSMWTAGKGFLHWNSRALTPNSELTAARTTPNSRSLRRRCCGSTQSSRARSSE